VALYEGLYGESPYDAHDDLQLLISAACRGEIRDPPQGTRVPRRLRKLLLRGLSPDPKHRFPSMDALLGQLERDTSRIRRQWIGVAAALGAAGGAVISLAGDDGRPECQGAEARIATIWSAPQRAQLEQAFQDAAGDAGASTWSRVQTRIDLYTSAWIGMHGQVCEAHQRGELSNELLDRSMVCLNLRFGALASLLETLAEPSQEIAFNALVAINELSPLSGCSRAEMLAHGELTPTDPAVAEIVATIRQELANARIKESTGQYAAARKAVDQLLERARATEFAAVVAEVLALDGDLKSVQGKYTEAVNTYAEGYWEALAAGHDELAAELAIAITSVLGSRQEQHTRALSWAKHAMALVRRTGERSLLHARLENTLGLVERGRGKLEQALEHHERAVAMFAEHKGEGGTHEADATRELGVALAKLGREDDAFARYEEALAIYTDQLGPEHPDVARTKLTIGEHKLGRGELREARRHIQEAYDVLARVFGPEHPDVADALTHLGNIFAAENQPVRARRTLKQALEIREKRLGADHPSLDKPLLDLAALSLREKAYADAETYYRRALEIEERRLGPQNPRLADALVGLGTVTMYRGKASAGVPMIERAIALLEANAAPPQDLANAKFALARTLIGMKRHQSESLSVARAAESIYREAGAADKADEVAAWIKQHDD
ncbi:MAG: tetratricopeptide repeat protein, partial [Myxococcales bacterium]|nr:tetratricopeptide repeat protein [Myxococcales bacterium]